MAGLVGQERSPRPRILPQSENTRSVFYRGGPGLAAAVECLLMTRFNAGDSVHRESTHLSLAVNGHQRRTSGVALVSGEFE